MKKINKKINEMKNGSVHTSYSMAGLCNHPALC